LKAFITGVAGFVGSRLAATLLEQGHEVVGLDSFTTYYDPSMKKRNLARVDDEPGFSFVEADLVSDGWQQSLEGVEVIFHQAGQPGVRASWDTGFAEYADRNVVGTQRLLEAAKAHAKSEPRFRRLVYASSSSIYGDAMTFPTHEGLVPAPFSPYGVTKLAAEHLCGVYARNWGFATRCLTGAPEEWLDTPLQSLAQRSSCCRGEGQRR
jgi:nucleoside-diphosphate-sugar epimerase